MSALKKALKRVRARSDSRHNLAHGEWGELIKDGRGEVRRFPVTPNIFDGISAAHSKADIKRIVIEMKSTLDALRGVSRPLVQEKQERRLKAWLKSATKSERDAYRAFKKRLASDEKAKRGTSPKKHP